MHQSQIDKATPRPWRRASEIHGDEHALRILGPKVGARLPLVAETIPEFLQSATAEANAALIVTAVNEHTLLRAVAEAAFDAKEGGYSIEQHDALCEALHNLEQFRKSGGE